MILSTQQMSRVHNLDEYDPDISVNGHKLERIKSYKLLGVHMNQHLKWDDHIKHTASACYATLRVLRKLKHLAPYDLRKQLAETDPIKTKLRRSRLLSTSKIPIKTSTTSPVCYLRNILSIVSSPSTRTAAWNHASSFSSGSSSGICLRATGLSGQTSSLCQRKAGLSIHLEFVSRASADCPFEASSAGFLLVSTCLH